MRIYYWSNVSLIYSFFFYFIYQLYLNFLYLYSVSSSLGIQAIDLGMPQLSMHSIREVQGTLDLTLTSRFLYSFLKDFNHVKNSLE